TCVFRVLSAIRLDDQPRLEADEVDDVALDWHLAPKLEAVQPMRPQQVPQPPLGVGGVAAYGFGIFAKARRSCHSPLSWICKSDLAAPESRKSFLSRKGRETPGQTHLRRNPHTPGTEVGGR